MSVPGTATEWGGVVTWQSANAQSYVSDGYLANDIVYSVIKLITDKAKVAPWGEYTVKDEAAQKAYKALMASPNQIKSVKQVIEMHHKAYEPVKKDQGTKLTDLMIYPNDDDTISDFIEAWGAYKLIVGNSYCYGPQVQFGQNKGVPNKLHILPAQYMQIIADLKSYPYKATAYQLYMGLYQTFTREETVHDRYFNPYANVSGAQLYGMSPLQAASRVITRSNEAKRVAVANYQNGGPKTLLYMDDARLTDPKIASAQADAIKKRLEQYQGADQANQAAVSGYKVNSIPLGLSPVELDLLRAEGFDIRALCNVYGVPSQLLNDPENKIHSNVVEAEKTLTTRCAIPLLNDIEKNLNRKFQTDWGFKGKNRVVCYDPQVYLELQENRAVQVDWLAKAWWIPVKQKYDIMGLDVPDTIPEDMLNGLFNAQGSPIDGLGDIDVPDDMDPYKQGDEKE